MRNRFLSLAAALCGVALMVLAGCDFGSQDEKPTVMTASKGTVRVVVDNGESTQDNSRTAVPASTSFTYTLTFSAEGKPDVTASLGRNTTGEVSIDAGTWVLNVIGQYNGTKVAEADPVTVTVPSDGDVISVSVTVHPVLNGSNGTFSYRISASGGLTSVSAVLTPLDVGSTGQSERTLSITSYSQTASVAPGYYRLKVTAWKGIQTLIRRELVHIYSYTTTQKTYELSEADFAPAVYLAGTLTGSIEGYSPLEVIAYEDADGSTNIGQSAVSGGAWNMDVESAYETLYFKVKLVKGGSAGVYYSKPVLVDGISAVGNMDMVLPIEAYTITFDASGGGFEDGGTTITMTAPENETLMPPSASHSEYAFTEWYSTDGKSFTAETPITGDATVYARWLVSIVITSLPTKTAYFVGEVLDLSGLVITEIYSNNTTKTETVSMDNVSGYNTDTTGQQVLTVTVNSKTATFTVTVNAITLVSIAITSPPTKTTYLTGESLNLSGLEVTGTYTNNTTKMESVSVDNISRYDTNSAGQQTLTVTVGDKTASFSIIIETPDDTEHSTLSVKDAILNDVNVLPSSTSAGYISMGYDKDLDCVVLTYKVGVIENMFLQYLSTVVVAAPGRKFTYTEIVGSSVTQQIENMSMVIASISGNIYFAGAKASAYTEAQFLGFGNGATAGTKASASAGNIGFDLTSVTRTTYTETYTNWLQVSNSLEQDMSVYEQGKKYAIAAFADVGVYQVLKYNPKTHNATAIPGKSLYFNVESIPAWDVYEYSKNEEIDIPNKLSPFQQIEITVSESDLYSDLKKSEQFKRTNDLNNIGSSSRDEVFNPSLLTAVLECFDYDKVRIDVSFAYKAESILGGGLRLQIANSNKSAELSRKEFSRGISWGDTSCSVTVDISSLNSPTCQFMLLWSKTRTCEYSVGTRTISITAVK